MKLLLRLALLAYPQPLRARYGAELAEFPVTPFSLLDMFFAGLRERLDSFIRDVRHASRSLLRAPSATAVAVLALASADDRFRTTLIGSFAALALILAGSGIFATVSFTVSRRTREIAIRRALRATAASVCAAALRGAMLACFLGAGVGLTAAYWLRSLTDGMLFEVDPVDPAAYATAAAILLVLTLAASLGPASRAARLDPARNLRAD